MDSTGCAGGGRLISVLAWRRPEQGTGITETRCLSRKVRGLSQIKQTLGPGL